jgi:hypothetical protein
MLRLGAGWGMDGTGVGLSSVALRGRMMGPRLRISQHRPEARTADKQAARRDGGSGGARCQGNYGWAVAEEMVMAMAWTTGRWR